MAIRIRTGLLVVAMILTTVTAAIAPAGATTQATKYLNGKIAFDSERDGDAEIYLMDSDGSNLTQLTNNTTGSDYDAAWSPDGSKLAFASERDGDLEIFTMNADGSNVTQLTSNGAADSAPIWSPDGTKMTFTSNRDGDFEVFTMNANGSNVVQLTSNTGFEDKESVWSPLGNKISFTSNRDGNYEVYIMNTDGTAQTRLTNSPDFDFINGWTPDGSKIAFISSRVGSTQTEIFTMNPDGSNQTRLTNTPEYEYSVGYSPDGTKLLTTIYPDENYGGSDVFALNADGSMHLQLTHRGSIGGFDEAFSSQAWQPLPYMVTTNDDGSVASTVTAGEQYPTTAFAVKSNETLVLDGRLGAVTVPSGGKISGTGTAGTLSVAAGGTVAPGHSPGCLSSGNLNLSGTYAAEIGGTVACTTYDQLQITGAVTLNNAPLALTRVNGFVPKVGDNFTMIANDGADAVTGTFAGLSEGSNLTVDGVTYKVSYAGGTGNDVVLIVAAVSAAAAAPGVPSTGFGQDTNNPLQILSITSLMAGALVLLARRLRQPNGKRR